MNKQEYLMVKLMEESAEVIQAVTKIKVFGFKATDPREVNGDDNALKFLKELGDLAAVIELLSENYVHEFSKTIPDDYIDEKKVQVMQYYDKLFGDK